MYCGFETVEALAVVDILRRADIKIDMISITGDINVKSASTVSKPSVRNAHTFINYFLRSKKYTYKLIIQQFFNFTNLYFIKY